MRHPFDLKISDLETVNLDFQEPLTREEAEEIGGGRTELTTQALGEEGGKFPEPIPFPDSFLDYPRPYPYPLRDTPDVTTLALGEEGG